MKLLCWNIHWACGADGRVDLDRIAAAIAAHDLPAVVCLQEVAVNHATLAGSRGEDQVAGLAARLPGYSAHFAAASDLPAPGETRALFGNLVLSRLPVQQVFRHALPWPADPACPSMPRVALEAVIDAPGGAVRVVTTHLEYFSARQRRAQVDALRRLHVEAAGHAGHQRPDASVDAPFRALPRPLSSIYCGDFNCRPEAAERAALLAPFEDGVPALVDAWAVAHPGEPHAPTVGLHRFAWPDEAFCCDYVFVSADLAPRIGGLTVDPRPDAADHQPLILTWRAG